MHLALSTLCHFTFLASPLTFPQPEHTSQMCHYSLGLVCNANPLRVILTRYWACKSAVEWQYFRCDSRGPIRKLSLWDY